MSTVDLPTRLRVFSSAVYSYIEAVGHIGHIVDPAIEFNEPEDIADFLNDLLSTELFGEYWQLSDYYIAAHIELFKRKRSLPGVKYQTGRGPCVHAAALDNALHLANDVIVALGAGPYSADIVKKRRRALHDVVGSHPEFRPEPIYNRLRFELAQALLLCEQMPVLIDLPIVGFSDQIDRQDSQVLTDPPTDDQLFPKGIEAIGYAETQVNAVELARQWTAKYFAAIKAKAQVPSHASVADELFKGKADSALATFRALKSKGLIVVPKKPLRKSRE